MRIIPVLDLLNGLVVRGVAGRRDEYRAIESRVSPSADPGRVAAALHEAFGLATFYVADLDAILGRGSHAGVCRELARSGLGLLLDCGVRTADDAARALESGAERVVCGLETLPGPEVLRDAVERCGPERVVFSLDLQNGRPLVDSDAWPEGPAEIAREAVRTGVRSLIVLDLAAVGVGSGPSTLAFCRALRTAHTGVELITGGGIRHRADLEACAAAEVDGVLVASALHDGSLDPADVRCRSE